MACRATHDAATASGPAAAADDEARNHQRGVPRHTNDVGATAATSRPHTSVTQHPTPPFSNFHRSLGTRPRFARKQLKNQKESTHRRHSWKRVASTA